MVVLLMTPIACSTRTIIDEQPCPNPPVFESYENVDPELLAQIRRNDSKWFSYSEKLRVRARCEDSENL